MNNKVGCLVIHGFGGDIQEVAPLASSFSTEHLILLSQIGDIVIKHIIEFIAYTDYVSIT